MATRFPARPYHLSVIAETGDRFADFTPYVAAIADDGVVVFSAALAAGGSGVFRGDGTHVATVADSTTGTFQRVCSHPDIDDTGSVCFYAEDAVGVAALYGSLDGEIVRLNSAAGPLGPTMNSGGTIAFRAPLPSGGDGIFTWCAGVVVTIADTNGRFSSFHGLPVIDGRGRVTFRANGRDGGAGIWVHDGDRVAVVAEEGARFSGFGHFPFTNNAGTFAFCAELLAGGAAIFAGAAGATTTLMTTNAGFESFRGALLNGAGELVFYATPIGGELGIYTGPDPEHDHLLAIGDELLDSTVAGFALNPVSINAAGQLAIRVALESGRQLIVRADRRVAGRGTRWHQLTHRTLPPLEVV